MWSGKENQSEWIIIIIIIKINNKLVCIQPNHYYCQRQHSNTLSCSVTRVRCAACKAHSFRVGPKVPQKFQFQMKDFNMTYLYTYCCFAYYLLSAWETTRKNFVIVKRRLKQRDYIDKHTHTHTQSNNKSLPIQCKLLWFPHFPNKLCVRFSLAQVDFNSLYSMNSLKECTFLIKINTLLIEIKFFQRIIVN
jgi:hypothetical protein